MFKEVKPLLITNNIKRQHFVLVTSVVKVDLRQLCWELNRMPVHKEGMMTLMESIWHKVIQRNLQEQCPWTTNQSAWKQAKVAGYQEPQRWGTEHGHVAWHTQTSSMDKALYMYKLNPENGQKSDQHVEGTDYLQSVCKGVHSYSITISDINSSKMIQ